MSVRAHVSCSSGFCSCHKTIHSIIYVMYLSFVLAENISHDQWALASPRNVRIQQQWSWLSTLRRWCNWYACRVNQSTVLLVFLCDEPNRHLNAEFSPSTRSSFFQSSGRQNISLAKLLHFLINAEVCSKMFQFARSLKSLMFLFSKTYVFASCVIIRDWLENSW